MAVKVTHSKTLVTPDSGTEDKVYGVDWVDPNSHAIAGLGTAAESATTDFDAAGAATTAVTNHVALADPHAQYALESALGTLATQSGTFSGTSSGTNTGDQTSIVGITGTLAQFNTACTNADFASGGGTATGANTGDQTITLTGDVTGSGVGSFAATIANAAVTLAKMADLAQDLFIIRKTASTGVPETATCTAAGRAILDDADAAAQRTTLGLGTLATQSGTFSGTSSGTNTGDQTITLTGNVTGSGAGSFATTIAAAVVTRAMLNAATDGTGGRNWAFLGQATASNAVRTGTITWTGTFKQLLFEYFISGYNGAAIGRLIVGPTAGLSETGTTFCTSLIEGVTITATSVSVPGWPTAVTAGAVPRYGWMYVDNQAAVVKRMSGHGQHSGTAPTTVPTQMRMEGMFNDTTNLVNKAELAVYAAITGAAISATTFNAGTYLNVWGRNDD